MSRSVVSRKDLWWQRQVSTCRAFSVVYSDNNNITSTKPPVLKTYLDSTAKRDECAVDGSKREVTDRNAKKQINKDTLMTKWA